MGRSKKWKKSFQIKQEKRSLHTKYICGIALSITLLSIVLSAYDHNAFVAQFDFASTIVSIVLSVIAIWLSISGEQKTTEIKDKIVESADRLSKTTKNVRNLNNQYKETMDNQLEKLENVQKQLSDLLASVADVKEQVAVTREELSAMNNVPFTTDTQPLDTEQLWKLFENINNWNCQYPFNIQLEWIFCQMVRLIMDSRQNNSSYNLAEVITLLGNSGVSIPFWNNNIHINWGIINTMIAIGVFNNQAVMEKIQEKIGKVLENNPFLSR